MNEKKLRLLVDDILNLKYGEKWDELNVGVKEMVYVEVGNTVINPRAGIFRWLRRAREVQFNFAFVILSLMLGLFGGLVSNIVHDSLKGFGLKYISGAVTAFFVLIFGGVKLMDKALYGVISDEVEVKTIVDIAKRYF